jgi:hypothetical protein
MPRSLRDPAGRTARARSPRGPHDTPATAPLPEQLSPAKRRIAEALAALLVAHYRREQEQAERDRVPLA